MSDLVAFLEARLAEDETVLSVLAPARVLAEVEAKRRLIEEFERHLDSGALDGHGKCYECAVSPERVLRILALPHAGHPDHDPAWTPDTLRPQG